MPLITEMWAWVCTESESEEGVPAINVNGTVLPLMGADRARVESLRLHAMSVAMELGLPVKLVRFTGMEVVEEIPAVKRGSG